MTQTPPPGTKLHRCGSSSEKILPGLVAPREAKVALHEDLSRLDLIFPMTLQISEEHMVTMDRPSFFLEVKRQRCPPLRIDRWLDQAGAQESIHRPSA